MATPHTRTCARGAVVILALAALALGATLPGAVPVPHAQVAGVVRSLPDDPPPADAAPGTADDGTPVADLPGDAALDAPKPPSLEVRPEPFLAPPTAMVAPELALLDETNRDRAAVGLARLVTDPELVALARARAGSQVARPALSHLDDGGALAFLSLIQRAGLRHQVAGENLVRLPGPIATAPARAERALMASPTHRANILEPRYGRLAIGMADDRDGRVIFAQLFRDGS
jgi:uncharacterized protein YkwD